MSIKFHHHIIISLLFSFYGVYAQQQHITLHHEDVPLREIFDDIEQQTGLIFSYGNKLIDHNEIVSVHVDQVSLSAALKQLFLNAPVNFMIIDKQIILTRTRVETHSVILESTDVNAEATRYTISGYVRDVASGEILIGATISVAGGNRGAITNNYGFYSLTLDKKYDSVICTYIGYQLQSLPVSAEDERIEFQLRKLHHQIAEVSVFSEEEVESLRTGRSSEQKVSAASVRRMPALFGEKDVIKSLAAIPGIKFYGDGSTIFYVRGGSRDQNLVTVDEAPIYNPAHLMGFFSTIVPDAVKDIQVYKGDFPANYGGRLSSLVDIRTKDGNMQEFGMDGSIGLLSSRLSLEGPILKDRISYFISGRRSYILRPLQAIEENISDIHFADFHLKLNYRMNRKNRFFFSIYQSEDNFESLEGKVRTSGINWKNAASTIRWNHLFSERLFSNTTLYASRYDYYLNTNLEQGDYWNSHIDNFSLKSDFTYYISPENTMRFGVKFARHYMNPGNFYQRRQMLTLPFEISTRSADEVALYIGDQVVFYDRLSVRAGIRITSWSNVGPAVEYFYDDNRLDSAHYFAGEVYHNYITGDPRLSMIYALSDVERLKFSYCRTSQFEHLITNSISPFSTLEVWLPSGPRIKPQRADQVTFGYSRYLRNAGLNLEAELYYKQMNNQVDYRDHAKLIMNPFIENELSFGEGRAYGIETMVSKKQGKLNGWFSYTYSRSFLQIDAINQGIAYPSYGDRPHDFSLFLSLSISPRLEFSTNFIYMTGAPFTAPTAFYYHENIQVPIYFSRNNDRLPDYHRLDLALNWDLLKKKGKFKHELIFSAYNVYARKNPVAVHFNKIEKQNGQLVIPYNFYNQPTLVPTQFYIYGFIPSVSYHFSF